MTDFFMWLGIVIGYFGVGGVVAEIAYRRNWFNSKVDCFAFAISWIASIPLFFLVLGMLLVAEWTRTFLDYIGGNKDA